MTSKYCILYLLNSYTFIFIFILSIKKIDIQNIQYIHTQENINAYPHVLTDDHKYEHHQTHPERTRRTCQRSSLQL